METPFVQQCQQDFAGYKPAAEPAWLLKLRRQAFDAFLQQGFPTPQDEGWKYTNLTPLAQMSFPLSSSNYPTASQRTPEGAWVGTLTDFIKEHPDVAEQQLGRTADFEHHPFVALNTALLQEGKVIYLPKGTIVAEPITLTYKSSGEQSSIYPHNLIIAESGSQAVVLEHYLGTGNYLTNAVTEVLLEAGSHLEHYKLQEEGKEATHLANLQVRQGRESHFTSNLIMVGAKLGRNEIETVLNGEGAECTLNGLYSVGGDQHVDNQTRIDHALPHGTSQEIYKGILDGDATAVFNGGIIVRADAQKTNARQLNKNLLLSNRAIVNTKPLLEILANDVKCTHGATIGRLDATQIFYLRSRGIGEEEARGLLTYAFANELLAKMKWKPFCLRFQERLFAHLTRGHLPLLEEVLS